MPTVDPLALVALGFLGAIIVVSIALGLWVRAQMRKSRGEA